MENLPLYKVILGNADGIQKMSLVEEPAVEVDFIALSKLHELKLSLNEEQHIVFGCALRADYPIYRGSYYVVFDRESIKTLYEDFMIKLRANKVNLEHSVDTDDVYLIQSFIKDSEKGINPVGFEDIADGSWFVEYKISNEEVWEAVKSGKFKGFSIEGFFNLEDPEPIDEIDALIDLIMN